MNVHARLPVARETQTAAIDADRRIKCYTPRRNSCEINVHMTFLSRAVTNSTGDFLRKSRLKRRHKSYAASPTDSLAGSFTRFTFAIFLIRLGESPVSHSCPRLIVVVDQNLQVLTDIHTCIVEIFLFP